MCKDCWFSKYNKVLLHYSVSIAGAAVYIPLSAAAVVVVLVVDTHHWSVDTDELFHAYFFYVSTWRLFSKIPFHTLDMLKTSHKTRLSCPDVIDVNMTKLYIYFNFFL